MKVLRVKSINDILAPLNSPSVIQLKRGNNEIKQLLYPPSIFQKKRDNDEVAQPL